MVAIAPFRAVRYAPGTDLARVTSPPHDTITQEQRDALARDPHSIVHVTLPAPDASDRDDGPNRFQRAAATLRAWLRDGVLVRDPKPAFYLYEIQGPRGRMRAFFCRLRLDPTYTHVRRHEDTLHRSKRERLRLLEASAWNPEPIWLLYRDERAWVEEVLWSNAFDEVAAFEDADGQSHRVWRVDRSEAVQEVLAQFDERDLVIADGHHRYQTSLDRHAATGRPEDNSILVCLTRTTDPGLRIQPTHRIVEGLGDVEPALERARACGWRVTELAMPEGSLDTLAEGLRAGACTVVGTVGGALRAWRLVRSAARASTGPLEGLAVSQVHDALLHQAWGIRPADVAERLRFTQDVSVALSTASAGAVAVLLSAEPVAAVFAVASAGLVMPPKATFFAPKPHSGLILGPCDEPEPIGWQAQVTDPGRMDFRKPPLA